jgi:hypothetical protein
LLSWLCVRFLWISSSPISVWAWACDAALISAKLWVRVSRAAALDLMFSPLRSLILLLESRRQFRLASETLDASSLIYSLLSLPLGSEIFLVSEKLWRASRFA